MATGLVYAATVLLLANVALGVSVATGVLDTGGFRWIHHAVFFAVAASTAAAAVVGLVHRSAYVVALVPALVVYAVLPRFAGGSPRHTALAVVAVACQAAALALIL